MAGHSKFKNIMHRKGRADAVRSKLFSKLSREITVAAKAGLPDPTMNARLRLAVANAKAESMPMPPRSGRPLAFDPREVSHFVHRSTETGQQPQSRGADRRIIGIDRDAFKERIDRRAQRSQRRHGSGEVLGRDRRIGHETPASIQR